MKIAHIFIILGTLVTLIVAGIVLAFALVSNDAVDKAVLSAVKGELDYVRTSVTKIVEATVAPAKTARTLLAANNYTISQLPSFNFPETQEQTQFANWTPAFEIFVSTLDAQPDLISYVYQTGRSPIETDRWVDFGSIADDFTTLEVPSLVSSANASIIDGRFPPWNLVPIEQTPRVVTGETWQLETAAMTQNQTENGAWTSVALFYDDFLDGTTSLMTFGLPMEFDSSTGECINGLNVDISVDDLSKLLRQLADKDNKLYIIDVRKTLFYEGALIASSVPETILPQYDPDTEETYFPTSTPNAQTNALMQRVFNAFGGTVQGVRASTTDAIITDFDNSVVAAAHVFATGSLHWMAISQVPNSFYYGSTQKTLTATIAIACVAVAVVAACFVMIHLALATPIVQMLEGMQNIANLQDGALQKEEPFLTELRPVHSELMRLDTAMQSFAKYVPLDVVKGLLATSSLCRLEMNPLYCVIGFSDLQGWTTLSETLEIEQLNTILTVYFEKMTGIIMDHGCVINKFIGDAIMYQLGAPRFVEKAESLAVMCALQMQNACRTAPISTEFDNIGEVCVTRIGLSAGHVLAGNVGSAARMSYDVFSSTVNEASRLEGFNKQSGTRILMSEAVAAAAARDGGVVSRLLGRVMLQGKGIAVGIFEPMGVTDFKVKGARKTGDDSFHASDSSGTDHEAAGTAVNKNSALKGAITGTGRGTLARARREHSMGSSGSFQGQSGGLGDDVVSARSGYSGRSGRSGRSGHSGGSKVTAFFASASEALTHFQRVSSDCRRDCPVTTGQRIFARVFSKAAKHFILGDFPACLSLLHALQAAVMNASLKTVVGSAGAGSMNRIVSATAGSFHNEVSFTPVGNAVNSDYQQGNNRGKRDPNNSFSLNNKNNNTSKSNLVSNNSDVIIVHDVSGGLMTPYGSGVYSGGAAEQQQDGGKRLSRRGSTSGATAVEMLPGQVMTPSASSEQNQDHHTLGAEQQDVPSRTTSNNILNALGQHQQEENTNNNNSTPPQQETSSNNNIDQQGITIPLDSFISEMQQYGGPAESDVPWRMLKELCEEYIQQPPEQFMGAIVAKGK